MLVKSLKLNDYRNYSNYFIEFNPKLNIIIGKNGIGKTNILESIMVVSNTKSFRTSNDQDLIKKDGEYLKIELESDTDKYKVVINNKSKSLYLNESLAKRTSDYIGKLNAILFKPSDLELFTDSPSERRKVVDLEIGKINNKYLRSLLQYNSLLKDKNKLLKEIEIDNQLLNVIEESMVPNIKNLLEEREKFVELINEDINDYYFKISGHSNKIKINYKKCCEIFEIEDCIKAAKQKDLFYHYATFGPHHDDYEFTIDGYDINSIASQGQKRMVMIAFKFALIKYIQTNTNIIPIVLLDDILSELDIENQERLLKTIPEDTQVIITNTDIKDININKEYKLINLKEEENV